MSQPEPVGRTHATPTPEPDEHAGGMTMAPPVFQLFADGDGSGSGAGRRGTTASGPAAQLQGEYAGFQEALQNILQVDASTPGPGSPNHPSTYDQLPGNGYTILWNVFKAVRWQPDFGRSAQLWARDAGQGIRDLGPELTASGVAPAPLIQLVQNAMAPIANPIEGSAAGTGMDGVFTAAIDANRLMGPRTRADERAARSKEQFAATLRATMVAAANIVSSELHAELPGQILNASSPYNYLSYARNREIGNHIQPLERLYDARWEVTSSSTRETKINWARVRFRPLLREASIREMLQALTTLDESGIATQTAAILAGIQQHVLSRMDALIAEPVGTPIAHNGQAITARPARGAGSGRARVATPVEYTDGAPVTAWEPRTETTNVTAYADLGDDPRRTLHAANIGPYRNGGYRVVYDAREYKIVLRKTGRPFFGIKYGGRSGMTVQAVNDLLAQPYFTDTQRTIMRAAMPQVSSEGGISSINTWDSQNLTVAGRGEQARRVSLLVNAAKVLMQQYEPDVDVATDLDLVQNLVGLLGAQSTEGTAGADGIRFNLPKIDELVDLLEKPTVHRAMTFAKINDSLIGFFEQDYRRGTDTPTRYDRDISAARVTRAEHEIGSNHLHPAIIGLAMHHRLGRPSYRPLSSAAEANTLYPQRSAYTNANLPDYVQLSKQVAHLSKIRLRSMLGQRSMERFSVNNDTLNAIFSQKVTDFNNYFSENGIEPENGGYFDYAAANSVMGFWTGARQFTGSETHPPEGHLFFIQGSGNAKRYFDCGPMTGGAAPEADTTAEPEGELETEE